MNILKDLYFSVLFLADDKFNKNPFLIEKAIAFIKVIAALSPIAFLLNIIHLWFQNNKDFVAGFLVVVLINAYVGMKKHKKTKTFNWEIFLKKTSEMLFVVIVIYILLSIIGNFTGDNMISDAFQILIQVMTLFYPGAKAIKNVHILTNGDYPPKWLMDKMYNFENEGDLQDLFNVKKKDDNYENQ